MYPYCYLAILSIPALLFGLSVTDPTPKRTVEQLHKEADQCASILYQFGEVHKDFFPDGLENAKRRAVNGRAVWPPPKNYSWRIAILPDMEEVLLYEAIYDASDKFAVAGTFTDTQLDKRPQLKRQITKMPNWLTLPRWKDKVGKTIFRRVIIKDKPKLFIISESSDLTLWMRSGDDLELTSGKRLPKIGGNFSGGFFALCGDGAVHFLSTRLSSDEVQKVLVTGEGAPAIRARDPDERKQDVQRLDLGKPQ